MKKLKNYRMLVLADICFCITLTAQAQQLVSTNQAVELTVINNSSYYLSVNDEHYHPVRIDPDSSCTTTVASKNPVFYASSLQRFGNGCIPSLRPVGICTKNIGTNESPIIIEAGDFKPNPK